MCIMRPSSLPRGSVTTSADHKYWTATASDFCSIIQFHWSRKSYESLSDVHVHPSILLHALHCTIWFVMFLLIRLKVNWPFFLWVSGIVIVNGGGRQYVLLSSQNEVICFSVWLLVEKGWGAVKCQGLCTQLLLINCLNAYLALLRASKMCRPHIVFGILLG